MQIAIIGGGVIGLNIALHLSENTKHDIFLLEKEKFLGHHTSTRNSEVIHAGFAYPPDSLKAKLCVEGNALTYSLLTRLKVPFNKCGKWVIACGEEDDKALEEVLKNAAACGVEQFKRSSVSALNKAEPEIQNVTSVINSATSGIMDAAEYIRALEVALSHNNKVNVIYPCAVTGIDATGKKVETDRGPIEYDLLINSAGLWADDIYEMRHQGSAPQRLKYEIIPFKGEYYSWHKGRIKTMIYPVPHRFLSKGDERLVSSMGIHTHRNIAGELLIGPSQVECAKDKKDDYKIVTPPEKFVEALSCFVKGVKVEDLEPAYAGNRPKLYKDGHPIGDFTIFREGEVIHLLGIESPALTAAPAIARYVAKLA